MHRSTIRSIRARSVAFGSVLVLLIAACAPEPAPVSDPRAGGTVRRIAVLPFQMASPSDAALRIGNAPVILADIRTDRPDNSPEKTVERLFLDRQRTLGRVQIVDPDRTGASYLNHRSGSFKVDTATVFRKMGQDLEVDGIVAGYVYRWRERKGLPYSVEKPASVAFDIHLYRAADGALLWRGQFDLTQASLMEDMLRISFFFKERGRWLTAEELAGAGMEETLKTFPAAP